LTVWIEKFKNVTVDIHTWKWGWDKSGPSLPKFGKSLMDPPLGFSNHVYLWTLPVENDVWRQICYRGDDEGSAFWASEFSFVPPRNVFQALSAKGVLAGKDFVSLVERLKTHRTFENALKRNIQSHHWK